MISQIHLGFFMNLTNNGHGSYQTLKNQYFANLVNSLMPFFLFPQNTLS